eukprot:s3595_g3.t1
MWHIGGVRRCHDLQEDFTSEQAPKIQNVRAPSAEESQHGRKIIESRRTASHSFADLFAVISDKLQG